jgi:hypothetical protein
MEAQPIFCQNECETFTVEASIPKFGLCQFFLIKSAQSKHWPSEREFSQSGHTAFGGIRDND